jgi:hypothetical protein
MSAADSSVNSPSKCLKNISVRAEHGFSKLQIGLPQASVECTYIENFDRALRGTYLIWGVGSVPWSHTPGVYPDLLKNNGCTAPMRIWNSAYAFFNSLRCAVATGLTGKEIPSHTH